MIIEDVANFLLIHPPIEELTEEISGIVFQFRNEMLTRKQALNLLLNKHEQYLQQYIDLNLVFSGLK